MPNRHINGFELPTIQFDLPHNAHALRHLQGYIAHLLNWPNLVNSIPPDGDMTEAYDGIFGIQPYAAAPAYSGVQLSLEPATATAEDSQALGFYQNGYIYTGWYALFTYNDSMTGQQFTPVYFHPQTGTYAVNEM